MEMEKAFKAIEEVQEYLGLEPDNADLEDLVSCDGGLVSFYDDKDTYIVLPFTNDGLDYDKINHIVVIERSFEVKYPEFTQQGVALDGVEREFFLSTNVVIMNYDNLLPLLKSCLEQFNKIKIDKRW